MKRLNVVGVALVVVSSGCVGDPPDALGVEDVAVDSERCIAIGPTPHGYAGDAQADRPVVVRAEAARAR